jgi:hypothetical protein
VGRIGEFPMVLAFKISCNGSVDWLGLLINRKGVPMRFSMADIDERGKVTAEVDCYVIFTGEGRFQIAVESIAMTRDEALRRLNQVTHQSLEDNGDDIADVIDKLGCVIGKLHFCEYSASRFLIRLEVDRFFDGESEGMDGLFNIMGAGLQSTRSPMIDARAFSSLEIGT